MVRKLIEAAIPLTAINDAAAHDKMPGIGKHPKNMHQWWARLPLPAARAVLFASIVNDPFDTGERPGSPNSENEERRRQLFRIIEDLVSTRSAISDEAWERATDEMLRDCDGSLPAVRDPFSGGGSIPLEAHRLGLSVYASDLNPVAVLLTKAQIEIPTKFLDFSPINPAARILSGAKWRGTAGLAEDVRYYGGVIEKRAASQIGKLYPRVVSADGKARTVSTWLWARTVKCSNPACGISAPLVRSFVIATRKSRQFQVVPSIESGRVRFDVREGGPDGLAGTVTRKGAICLGCKTHLPFLYIKAEGRNGRLGKQPLAIVAEDTPGRVYLNFSDEHAAVANEAVASDSPDTPLPDRALGFRVQAYGLTRHRDLFTERQLCGLTTFVREIAIVRAEVLSDAQKCFDESTATEYADALSTYLALAVSKLADYNCSLSRWKASGEQQMQLFGRQVVPMVWDFAESNPFATKGITWMNKVGDVCDGLEALHHLRHSPVAVNQLDAAASKPPEKVLVSTDPPYYDNIGYSDLSDFFYVWLRKVLAGIMPELFSTLLSPKKQELIATPDRFDGDSAAARKHFENGFEATFSAIRETLDERFPLTVYYAFKQTEDDEEDEVADRSTGWESLLQSLIDAGFQVTSTWPIHASQKWRMRSMGSNALASYIVLACRVRRNATIATRRELIGSLKRELPRSLKDLQQSNIAAVDLAQAAIGPGMAVFSRYAKVVENDGSPMRVRSALQLINQALDEVLSEQESEYDADTQWAVAWFDQFGMKEAPFGEAETLSRAKNTAVNGLVDAGIVRAAKGRVQLLSGEELPGEWDPTSDKRLTVWEVTQQLIRRLQSGGEREAAGLLRKVGGMGEIARDLAYRLYSVCERKGWTDEAIAYNSLVVAWPEITRIASEGSSSAGGEEQESMFR